MGAIAGFAIAWWRDLAGGLVTVGTFLIFSLLLVIWSGRWPGIYFYLFVAPGFLHIASFLLSRRGSVVGPSNSQPTGPLHRRRKYRPSQFPSAPHLRALRDLRSHLPKRFHVRRQALRDDARVTPLSRNSPAGAAARAIQANQSPRCSPQTRPPALPSAPPDKARAFVRAIPRAWRDPSHAASRSGVRITGMRS